MQLLRAIFCKNCSNCDTSTKLDTVVEWSFSCNLREGAMKNMEFWGVKSYVQIRVLDLKKIVSLNNEFHNCSHQCG